MRPDSYGIVGMRERAADIGADDFDPRHESGGTEIRVDMQMRRGGTAVGLTVMLVDDHTMLRQGLRRALESEGITVVAEAGDGARR